VALFKFKRSHKEPIALTQSELGRLLERECDLEQRLNTAQSAVELATSRRDALLVSPLAMTDRNAIAAADERVVKAEMARQKLMDALATARRARQAAEQKIDAERDHAWRMAEAEKLERVVAGITKAVDEFEQSVQQLASALNGSLGKTTDEAPLLAASLRVGTVTFALQARNIVDEIKRYRVALLEGLAKAMAPARRLRKLAASEPDTGVLTLGHVESSPNERLFTSQARCQTDAPDHPLVALTRDNVIEPFEMARAPTLVASNDGNVVASGTRDEPRLIDLDILPGPPMAPAMDQMDPKAPANAVEEHHLKARPPRLEGHDQALLIAEAIATASRESGAS